MLYTPFKPDVHSPQAIEKSQMVAYKMNLKAVKRGSPVMTTPAQVRAVWQSTNWRCIYSLQPCTLHGKYGITLDHITPCADGGTNAHWNLIPATRYHNSLKRDKPLREFLAEIHLSPDEFMRRWMWAQYRYHWIMAAK